MNLEFCMCIRPLIEKDLSSRQEKTRRSGLANGDLLPLLYLQPSASPTQNACVHRTDWLPVCFHRAAADLSSDGRTVGVLRCIRIQIVFRLDAGLQFRKGRVNFRRCHAASVQRIL